MNDQNPDQDQNWADRAQALVKDMGKQGLDHPSSSRVLTGAAIGCVLGIFIFDAFGFILGAANGGLIAIAIELKNQED